MHRASHSWRWAEKPLLEVGREAPAGGGQRSHLLEVGREATCWRWAEKPPAGGGQRSPLLEVGREATCWRWAEKPPAGGGQRSPCWRWAEKPLLERLVKHECRAQQAQQALPLEMEKQQGTGRSVPQQVCAAAGLCRSRSVPQQVCAAAGLCRSRSVPQPTGCGL
uniref:Uncharacterized protein n=1 Tax=Knipowitschia caucasica TaxID=637954 RepID=A0AAV2JBD4_KNICA